MVANLAVGKPWASAATTSLGALFASAAVVYGMLGIGDVLVSSRPDQAQFTLGAAWVVSGVAAAGFLLPAIRKDVAAWLPVDPGNPVHTLALMFAVILLGTNLATIALTDVLGTLSTRSPQQLTDLFFSELPLLVIAVAGVGIFIRRSGRETLARLGVVAPAWWHVVLALAAAGAFLALLVGVDSANHLLLPRTAERVDSVNGRLLSEITRAGLMGAIVISLLPGICEDALFRGAIQPRLGLVPTALLFTSIHQQYGLSLDLAGVFALAVGLGLIRKYTNTTTSILTHAAYNFIGGVLPSAGPGLYAAVAAEVVLVAIAAAVVWNRRRVKAVANPRPEA